MSETIRVSTLGKTWILDLDGTIVKHNGYKLDGHDVLLPGAKEFLANIRPNDVVIFITSRTEECREMTLAFLNEHKIRYDHIIFNAPYGERILVNDCKPSGLQTAIAINTERDQCTEVLFEEDETI